MDDIRVEIPESWFEGAKATSNRKVGIPVFAREVVSRFSDYRLGAPLKFPGGYVNKGISADGQEVVIGFKSALYRWLNTATALVSKCDIIFVTTFRLGKDDDYTDIELWEFRREDLMAIFDKVHDERRKQGKDNQHIYVPIDESELKEWEGYLCAVGGSLDAVGRKIFEAPILWSKAAATTVAFRDGAAPDPAGAALSATSAEKPAKSVAAARAFDITKLVYRHKEAIAEELGLPVTAVNISVSL